MAEVLRGIIKSYLEWSEKGDHDAVEVQRVHNQTSFFKHSTFTQSAPNWLCAGHGPKKVCLESEMYPGWFLAAAIYNLWVIKGIYFNLNGGHAHHVMVSKLHGI